MCFHSKQSKTAQQVENRFNAKITEPNKFQARSHINGFDYVQTPVITNLDTSIIQHYNWGLIPDWSKDDSIRQYTLNAKIETLDEKSSFKNITQNRCLIIADGFFEWQWLDLKGKQKQKYEIGLPDGGLFSFGGLYSQWSNTATDEIINSYTIVTTEANEVMAEIHNTKKRMPIILTEDNEDDWLEGENFELFKHSDIELNASKIYDKGQNLSLF